MKRTAKIVGGGAALLGTAAVAYWLRERTTEQPRFDTEAENGQFSLRRYPALLVAETVTTGERKAALNTGFDRLARFIFARDRPDGDRRRIAMTAPVLSERTGGSWRTRFVMPRDVTASTLPTPGPEVTTATLPARKIAAVTFAGRATDADLHDQERALRAWLLGRSLKPTGPAEYAFYNSPFIPGPLRRNEVLLPVA